MCMFCAAIPAALAIGASRHAKQTHTQREAQVRGEAPHRPAIAAGPATLAVVILLLAGSTLVHTKYVG